MKDNKYLNYKIQKKINFQFIYCMDWRQNLEMHKIYLILLLNLSIFQNKSLRKNINNAKLKKVRIKERKRKVEQIKKRGKKEQVQIKNQTNLVEKVSSLQQIEEV